MNIFIDTRGWKPDTFSGISEYTRLLTERLIEDYPEHRYLLFANGFRRKKEMCAPEGPGNMHSANFRIPNRIFDFLNLFLAAPKIDALFPSDVFWSPNINILSFRNPKRRVLTIHDISFHYPEFFSSRERLWHWRQNYAEQIRTAGHLVAVSDFTKETLVDTFKIPEEKITRIYSGIDPLYLETSHTNTAARDALRLPERFLLYSGTIEPRKNIIAIIRAFSLLKQSPNNKDLSLVLAGSPGWLYATIFKEAARSPYSNAIIFWGKADPEVMRLLYRRAEAFVYPSFFEGFGFPPLEAQACGTPVIASNRTSLPEILGGSALLVNPWNVRELADAIEAFLEHPALRASFIRKGKENAARFDWRKSAAQYMKLFASIAQRA